MERVRHGFWRRVEDARRELSAEADAKGVDVADVALIAPTQVGPADWERKLELVKRTVCGGQVPPDDAFELFLHVCRRSGLDPLMREAWLVERQGTWQPMAARDGYLAAAHRSGLLSGIQTVVYPEDASKPPTHATCTVWRRDWTAPVIVTVAFREYTTGRSTWSSKPRTMIGKVAEAHALRRAFSLHGTFTPDELPETDAARGNGRPAIDAKATPVQPEPDTSLDMGREEANAKADSEYLAALDAEAEKIITETYGSLDRDRAIAYWHKVSGVRETADAAIDRLRSRPGNTATDAQIKKISAMLTEHGIPDDQFRPWLRANFGVESRKSLVLGQVDKLVDVLSGPNAADIVASGKIPVPF